MYYVYEESKRGKDSRMATSAIAAMMEAVNNMLIYLFVVAYDFSRFMK